ncbi:MAG: sugar ABC transporter ATP-binding protein [Spirochaetia bacterium]|jgi:ribose transport system ATP-binding protein|nr:sugar ABC transporter ATP-binding protein [Spirochaetia bacterium]
MGKSFEKGASFKVANLVEFKNITKRFPGVVALNNASATLREGEVHVLVGENGAGKSTLMKILSGAYTPDAGGLVVGGRAIEKNSPALAAELGISMIYQELNLIPELSVMQNLFLGHEKQKLFFTDNRGMYGEAKKYLEMLNLNIDPKTQVKNIGAGTQQMVEIAKALSKDSRILVLDEPTSSLADSEIKELFRIIKLLRDRGVGMFYISHRLEELYEIGDRVTVMRDGSVIGTYGINEIGMDKMIEQIAGRAIRSLFPHARKEARETVLEVKNCHGDRFRDVSLKVRSGEIVGLSGLIGSGRTELARAIFGIDPYYCGEILLNGKKVPAKNPQKSVARGIGLLPEDRKVQGLSLLKGIRENMVVTSLDRLGRRGFTNMAREKNLCAGYVRSLSIATPSIEKLAGFLSGGTQQKVVIAKWLIADLKLFIFDEPTRGIDVGAKSEIYRLMDGLVGKGAAILMISSDLPEILGMSDRIYVMAEGRIRGELDRGEATQTKILQYAYRQESTGGVYE